ncbi:MAG: signal peptidase II [Bacilli bacterium]|nr:signal peptidase II [Bacilli bacterium]
MNKEKIKAGLKWFYQSFIWIFILFLAIDIATKQIVMHLGGTPGTQIANWGIVKINYILNYNAAFGLGAKDPTVSRVIYLIVASLVTAGLITYLIIKRKTTKLYVRACLILIITGAVGNMIDRIFYAPYHAVVDWIDFYWFWDYNFNIADSCIVVAAFMLIIYIIVLEVKDYMAKRKAEGVSVKTLSKTEKERLEEENKEREEDK